MHSQDSLVSIACDTRALVHNYQILQSSVPKDTKIMCVVKGNAYGHGIENVVPALKSLCPDFYAVFTINEARIVRLYDTVTPILLLQPYTPALLPYAHMYQLTFSVSNLDALRSLASVIHSLPIAIHLCIESGLGRDGFLPEDMQEVFALLDSNATLLLTGVYTHFSGAESRQFDSLTRDQVDTLLNWKSACVSHNLSPVIHASGTAGALLGHGLDMCRFGIGLYGLWPSEETRDFVPDLDLIPVLRMTTRVIETKLLPVGSGIGYDATYITSYPTRTAIVPVGYANGIPRTLSNNGEMLVRGMRAPIRGRVMMNMCVLDVTHVPNVGIGDEVVIVGKQGLECNSIDDLAKRAGTINYEFVTSLRA